MNSQCLISFGSNLGDRDQRICAAARMIAESHFTENFATSRLFETPPIGGPGGQEPFLNGVAAFDTTSTAREILALLQETEDALGRKRRQRWGARSIDLDVVLHGELIGGGTGLVVPHPRYTARQFVLQPACDVAPHYRDPRFGWTIERLSHHLSQGSASLALVGGGESTRNEICRRLNEDHGILTIDSNSSDSAMIELTRHGEAWVSNFVPPLPSLGSDDTGRSSVPRLVARIQRTTSEMAWPAPHQMWPSGWQWPEYRLEVDDLDWAVSEVASALASMRCPIRPVTDHVDWWK